MATDYTQDANCLAAYLFSEGSGESLDDASPNSNTGTFKGVGEPAWSSTVPNAHVSYSADFDGIDDVITVTDFISSNQTYFSVCAWVYFDTSDSDDRFIEFSNSLSDGFLFWRDDVAGTSGRTDCFSVLIKAATTDYRLESATNSAPSGAWIHVCFTFSSAADELRLYINSSEDANSPQTVGSGDMKAPTANLQIGGGASRLDGKITEIGIFNRVLTPTEITDIYTNGLRQTATTKHFRTLMGVGV